MTALELSWERENVPQKLISHMYNIYFSNVSTTDLTLKLTSSYMIFHLLTQHYGGFQI